MFCENPVRNFKVKFKPFKTFSTKVRLQTNKFSGALIVSARSAYLYFVNIYISCNFRTGRICSVPSNLHISGAICISGFINLFDKLAILRINTEIYLYVLPRKIMFKRKSGLTGKGVREIDNLVYH